MRDTVGLAVHARFEEARTEDPVVLVQDYHFALLPAMIRERLPDATIIAFWHIPWPNSERFSICPYQAEILEGLLGSSIVGFQTPQYCHNFLETADHTLEVRIGRQDLDVVRQQQALAAATNSNTMLVTARSLVKDDGYHRTLDGQKTLGEAIAMAMTVLRITPAAK